AALESAVLRQLAGNFPGLAVELDHLRNSIVDLQIPFQQFDYYHPRQYGKLSLKIILPLLTEVGHQDLELQSGMEANLNYYFLSNTEAAPADIRSQFCLSARSKMMSNLKSYCAMDTEGLIHILYALCALAR
ncbi:MAG: DUF2779 domain-containing protein, partial [Chloroflexota bacterium]